MLLVLRPKFHSYSSSSVVYIIYTHSSREFSGVSYFVIPGDKRALKSWYPVGLSVGHSRYDSQRERDTLSYEHSGIRVI